MCNILPLVTTLFTYSHTTRWIRIMRPLVLAIWFCLSGEGMGSEFNLIDYLGCYLDTKAGVDFILRDLKKNNSRNSCKDACKPFNTRYAGTKDGVLCLCGNIMFSSTKVDEDSCSISCPNVQGETCGGKKHIQIYDRGPCHNGDLCNGFECLVINGADYRCTCPDGLTGKNCDQNTTEAPTTTTPSFHKTTTQLIVNISSTIVGNGSETTTSVPPTHVTVNIANTDDTVLYNNNSFTAAIIVIGIVVVLNCVCVIVWCIYKHKTKENEMEPENIEDKSGILAISGNKTSVEMEALEEYGEGGVRCSMNDEVKLYDLIDDTDLSIYENLDLANHCGKEDERLFSGIYSNVNE